MSESVLQQGWVPVGQTQLAEYAATLRAQEGPGPRDYTTWQAVAARPSIRDLLPRLVVEHARLLHAADTLPLGGLCQGALLKEALRRYETLWLPLLAHCAARAALGGGGEGGGGAEGGERAWRALVPPLDVAFVWHLHRLRPSAYAKDVAAATRAALYAAAAAAAAAGGGAAAGAGGAASAAAAAPPDGNGHGHAEAAKADSSLITPAEVIARACTGATPGGIMFAPDPLQAFRFSDGGGGGCKTTGDGGAATGGDAEADDDQRRGAATARAWAALHGASGEPFWPPQPRPDGRTGAYSSAFSADLGAAAVRQPMLMRQLLRPAWRRGGFVRSAVSRYARWLLLLKRNPVAVSRPVAPLDVALAWRAHASCLALYAEDCAAILGAGKPLPVDCGAGEGAGDAGDAATLDRGEPGVWRLAWGECKGAWDAMYGSGGDGGGGGGWGSGAGMGGGGAAAEGGEASASASASLPAPFVVPGAAFASMDAALPGGLEARAQAHAAAWRDEGAEWRAGLHALYLDWLAAGTGAGAAAVARAAAAAASPSGPAAAAGSPAPRPPPKRKAGGGGGGLFACFACGAGDADDDGDGGRLPPPLPAGDARAALVAAGFCRWRGLPHATSHPYWREGGGGTDPVRMLADGGGSPPPGVEGPELDDDLSR